MVDVTKSNFESISNRIESLLPLCSFVSIDLEFTGLKQNKPNSDYRLNLTRNDLPSQRYMKQRELIDNFLMIQFGVCLWKYDPESFQITGYPFNFWTFPSTNPNNPNNGFTFLCQSSSLTFLRQNGFDFNKLIDGGINFLSIDQEKKQRDSHQLYQEKKQQRVNERKENKIIIKPKTEKDIQFLNEIEQKLDAFLNNDNNELLELGLINRFHRLLIYQLIDAKYSNSLIAFKQIENKNENCNIYLKHIAVQKLNTNDLKSKTRIQNEQNKLCEQKWNENITNCVGVRKIFDMITLNEIPTIFHNGFLDAMHLYRSFIGHLPFDPCIFTQQLHKHLPFIADTKYIVKHLFKNENEITQTNFSLAECFKFFMNQNKNNNNNNNNNKLCIDVCVDVNNERNSEKEKMFLESSTFHSAGYDAFCTGYIFAKLGEYLHALNDKNIKDLFDLKDEFHSNENGEMITFGHFVNRLNLSQNFSKHFYVGNKYYIDDKFNFNLKFNNQNNNNNQTEFEANINENGIFCGVDYNAINNEWYKMFYCNYKIVLQSEQNESEFLWHDQDIENIIIEFLKEYITDQNRINIYKRGYQQNQTAIVRIIDIKQTEYDEIINALNNANKQPNNVEFIKYVEHKSKELRQAYEYIYTFKYKHKYQKNNYNKKRSIEAINNDNKTCNDLKQPPTKRQRIN